MPNPDRKTSLPPLLIDFLFGPRNYQRNLERPEPQPALQKAAHKLGYVLIPQGDSFPLAPQIEIVHFDIFRTDVPPSRGLFDIRLPNISQPVIIEKRAQPQPLDPTLAIFNKDLSDLEIQALGKLIESVAAAIDYCNPEITLIQPGKDPIVLPASHWFESKLTFMNLSGASLQIDNTSLRESLWNAAETSSQNIWYSVGVDLMKQHLTPCIEDIKTSLKNLLSLQQELYQTRLPDQIYQPWLEETKTAIQEALNLNPSLQN